jgi:hypothetical protein
MQSQIKMSGTRCTVHENGSDCGFHEKIASLQHSNYTQVIFASLIVAVLFPRRVDLTLTNTDLERM